MNKKECKHDLILIMPPKIKMGSMHTLFQAQLHTVTIKSVFKCRKCLKYFSINEGTWFDDEIVKDIDFFKEVKFENQVEKEMKKENLEKY